jgi:hypothetical protein
VTSIRQQNPPGPLKLLGLREKTGKNTDFDFAQITLNILVAHVCPSVYRQQRGDHETDLDLVLARL